MIRMRGRSGRAARGSVPTTIRYMAWIATDVIVEAFRALTVRPCGGSLLEGIGGTGVDPMPTVEPAILLVAPAAVELSGSAVVVIGGCARQ